MGCAKCGEGPKKYKHERIKTKKKKNKKGRLVAKTKPRLVSKISPIIKPQVPVVSKIKTGGASKNARLLKNCPLCKSPMREVSKLGEGKYMECVNPNCRYSRKNVD